MSSFLQQLKSGGFEIDNSKGQDAAGVLTRRVEKHFVGEQVGKLGLVLSDDGEILEIIKGTPAGKANVPIHFIIFDVNDQFVESRKDFDDIVNSTNSLHIVIKMQAVSPISELIAMTIRDDEARDANAAGGSASRLDYEELMTTTPRFSFLSVNHPLFRRFNNRLQDKREAAALVRRRTQETEEQLRRERSELIRREMEAAAEEERKKKQMEEERIAAEKLKASAAAAAAEAASKAAAQDAFIKTVTDESTFAAVGASETPAEKMQKENASASTTTTTTNAKPEPNTTVVPRPPAPEEVVPTRTAPTEAVSAAELLALIGVSTPPPPPAASNSVLGARNSTKSEMVTCVTLPTEEYTLSTGERVVCNLKKRTGPIPNPPPGSPPHVKRTADKAVKRPRAE